MTTILRANRICETSTGTGVGAYNLDGTVTGYLPFASRYAVGDLFEYFAEAINANGSLTGGFEIGVGTYAAGNTLARTTIYSSSNANNPVNWPPGTKRIAVTLAAESLDNLPVSAQQAIPIVNAATSLIRTQKIMAQMALNGVYQ